MNIYELFPVTFTVNFSCKRFCSVLLIIHFTDGFLALFSLSEKKVKVPQETFFFLDSDKKSKLL